MKNADKPAMPLSGNAYQDFASYNENDNRSSYNPQCQGLTKREHFAAMAMQGILSNTDLVSISIKSGGDNWYYLVKNSAWKMADAMLDEKGE